MLIPVMKGTTFNIRGLAVPLCPAKQITESNKSLLPSKHIGASTASLQRGTNIIMSSDFVGGAVITSLVHSTLEQGVWVQTLVQDIVLYSWARHFTLKVSLSTQVYEWVPANLMPGGNPVMDLHPIQGGVKILLVASYY